MNNFLFKKIAVAFVGIAMAIGVGVGVSQTSGVKGAKAEDVTSEQVLFGKNSGRVKTSPFSFTKNDAVLATLTGTVATTANTNVGFTSSYTFAPATGYVISSIAITCTSSDTYKPGGTYSVDGGTGVEVGTLIGTFSNLNATTSVVFTPATDREVRLTTATVVCTPTGGGDTPVTPTYSVTYVGNGNDGGTVPEDDTKYESGDQVTIPNDVPTHSRCTFAGWNDGTTTRQAGSTFSITADTTLTAVWTLNATHAGTEQDPYDALDAKAAIDTNTGVSNVYVHGTVSAIQFTYTAENGVTFTISDDGETTGQQIKAYKCSGTNADVVDTGDEVVVHGSLSKYNSEYQLGQGNQIASLTRPDSITRKATSFNLYLGEDLDLTTCVVAKGFGTLSFSIPNNTTVATLNGTTLTANDSEKGSVVVTANKGSESTTFTVVVKEEPLHYVLSFGTTYSANNQHVSEVGTDTKLREKYTSLTSDVTFSNFTKIYAGAGYDLKLGSGSASASLKMTISSDSYIVGVTIKLGTTAASVPLKIKSDATDSQVESQTMSASATLTFDDYLESEQSNAFTMSSEGNGAFGIESITIDYLNFVPTLSADISSLDLAVNKSANITLTADHFTPTSYAASIKSGESLTTSNVNVSANPIVITAGDTTGVTIVTITGSGGGKQASVDITVTVTNPRNLTGLSITTQSDAVSFMVGESFDVGILAVTGSFDAAPDSVVYSKSNGNIALLTISPTLNYVFTESDIGTVHVSISFELGTGSFNVNYDVTVVDKDYAHKVTSVSDLWDGQTIYFANAQGNKVATTHSGGNNLPVVDAVVNETKGLCLTDSADAQGFTVGRVKLGSNVYYTFYDGQYYLSDTGYITEKPENKNFLGRSAVLVDEVNNCTYFSITIEDGEATITSKTNSVIPYLRWNSSNSVFSCYSSGQAAPILYATTSYSEEAVAEAFESKCLLMDSYDPTQSTKGQPVVNPYGQCTTYYWEAKKVWEAMSDDEKIAISSKGEERLIAWATANGEELDSDMHLVPASRAILFAAAKQSTTSIIIVVISMASITAFGAFLFLRKRKEQ